MRRGAGGGVVARVGAAVSRSLDPARDVGRAAAAAALGAALALLSLPSPADAQGRGGEAEISARGLVRAGVRAGGSELGERDGFELFDVRAGIEGRVGILFDYRVQAEFVPGDGRLRLLDALLSAPLGRGQALELGLLKAPFGKEFLEDRASTRFVERAQVSVAIPPGRQVGLQLRGSFLEERLAYRAGVFNGNGRRARNDDDSFLYAARVRYNTIGPAAFYDELVVEVGADVAFSSDSAVDLTRDGRVSSRLTRLDRWDGDRLLYGFDLSASYRGASVAAEYLRGEFDPEGVARLPGVSGELVAEGAYVEAGYALWGFLEWTVRYDVLSGFFAPPGDSEFLLAGVTVRPGYDTRIGLQYAVGLGGSTVGPGVADGEFALRVQVEF